MEAIRTIEQEAAEDVFFGQVVIIWARWFLIAAGAVLVVWKFNTQATLTVGIIPILVLMVMNFYLHGRYLMEKPVGTPLIILTSLVDLVIITVLVAFWSVEPGEPRLRNQFFIFYYPMVLSFAFVMPRRIEIAYTVAALVLYTLVMAFSLGTHETLTGGVAIQNNLKTLLFRLVTLGAMGGLGNYYFRIQRARRRGALAGGS